MPPNPTPEAELGRIAEVSRLRAATDKEIPFLEELTRQAADLFHAPVAAITLVDEDRVWFKTHFGLDISQIERENSLCDLVIRADDVLVIPDTRKHPIASTKPMVASHPGVRFYAAAPLRSRFGYNVGTLCIMDVHPRTFSDRDRRLLRLIAEAAAKELELRATYPAQFESSDVKLERDLFTGGPIVLFKRRAADGWPVEFVSQNVSQFGYTPSEFVSGLLPYAQIVHPCDLERVEKEIMTYTQRGAEAFSQEYRILRKNGQYCWVYDYTSVVRDASGQITHYLGYIMDITSRKETEQALQESWARYETAVEMFPGFVYLCSADYKLSFINRRLLAYLGRDAIGEECYKVIHQRTSPCPFCDALSLQRHEMVRWEGLNPADKKWYSTLVTPLRHPDGSVSRLAFSQDITERKENETAALRRDAILSAVAHVVELLLKASDWRHVMRDVLAQLGQAVEADRAYLIENETLLHGSRSGSMSYEWTAPNVPARIYSPFSHHIPYDDPVVLPWTQKMAEGHMVEALTRDLPAPFRQFFENHGVKSLIILPILFEKEWWGGIGFDFCSAERRCLPVELEALRTAAALFGTILARNHYQRSLHESHRRQRAILDAIPDLIFQIRRDGTFIDFSAKNASDLAVECDQIIGNKIQDLLPPNVSSKTLTHIKKALEKRELQSFEYELNLRGTSRRFEARMAVSGPDEVLCIVRDITEQSKMQIMLKTFGDAIEQMPDAVMLTDRQGNFIYVNSAFEQMSGYPSAEAIGQKASLLKSGAHPAQFYQNIWDELLAGRTVHTEFINRRKDGTLYHQDTTITPIRDASGEILHFVAVAKDITERKQAEHTIRKLAAFPQFNPNAVLEFDANGSVIYTNRAAESLLQQLGCTNIRDILPQDISALVRSCLLNNNARRGVETIVGGHTLSWSFFPVAETQTAYAYGADISEQRSMEMQLRHLQKMEAVGRLAGGLAHDFNNILTAILGYSSMLLSGNALSDGTRAQIREINEAAERASRLTQHLLTFSRRQVMQRQTVDINKVIERLHAMLRRLINENIEILYSYEPDLPAAHVDVGMLEQVIVNIIINARDAMPNGGRITVSTYSKKITQQEAETNPKTKSGPMVCIEIADTGHGMSEHVKAHLFEPFFTTKEKGRGTGLGLATAYGIVRQHNGWIDVESLPGQGSVFRIFIPASANTLPTNNDSPHRGSMEPGHATVLLVEDEPRVRTLATTILKATGYRVLESASGQEALELWDKHHDDITVLIADVVVPGSLSGTDLAEQLYKKKPSLRIILISGYRPGATNIRFPPNCPHVFLPKPFTPADLSARVREVLNVDSLPSSQL